MQDTYQSIAIGVSSGVLASAFVYLIVLIFNRVFIPWYQQKTYHGVDISGKWHWLAEGIQAAQLEISQKASSIVGVYTIVCLNNNDSRNSIRTYNVQGEIVDRFIYLNLKSNDKSKLGAMVFLLEVVGDGSELKGFCSSYAIDAHEIVAIPESFFKTETQAQEYSRKMYRLPDREANKSSQKDTSEAIASAEA